MTELPAFANEPVLELRRADERARLEQALARLEPQLPLSVATVIGPDRGFADEFPSVDPSAPQRTVAVCARILAQTEGGRKVMTVLTVPATAFEGGVQVQRGEIGFLDDLCT